MKNIKVNLKTWQIQIIQRALDNYDYEDESEENSMNEVSIYLQDILKENGEA